MFTTLTAKCFLVFGAKGSRNAMNDYLLLLLGILCAGIGGEMFVRGAVGIAEWARISPGIIGATVAAFATSSPELFVGVTSAQIGKPEIALGDSLGSNVVNVAFILALALVISGIQAPRQSVRRDFTMALLAPVFTGLLFLDGKLSRIDGVIMLLIFFVWLFKVIMEVRKERSAAGEVLGEHRSGLAILSGIVGLGFLIAAGNFIVTSAQGIATDLGVDKFIVSATVVALGTGTPELATVIISKLRGHDEVGLGTILGSNIFNGLWIVGIAATIYPIAIGFASGALILAFGLAVVALSYPTRNGFIGRGRGVLLMAVHVAYLVAIVQMRPA